MRTAFLRIEGCKVGYRVAEDVYNKHNGMLVPKDFVITERIINVIKANEISAIKVYLEEEETSEYEIDEPPNAEPTDSIRQSVEDYKLVRCMDLMKVEETFFDISKGKPVNKTVMNDLSNNIIESFDTRLVPYIGKMKTSDSYLYEHTLNMGTLASLFAKWLKFDLEKTNNLIQAALLHDIGRVKLRPELFNKAGKLTKEEFDEVKQHSTLSYKLLQDSTELSNDIKMGVLMHHERNDGSGYPLGAKGVQIHEFGKILAIIDIYDAMTTDKVYKPKLFTLNVLNQLYLDSFEKLDYGFVNTFIKNMLTYFTGCTVRLNTGEEGFLVHIDERHITKPIIKIDNTLVNLQEETDLEIDSII